MLRFPRTGNQDPRFEPGQRLDTDLEGSKTLTVTELDRKARRVWVKTGAANAALLPRITGLHPTPPLDTGIIAEAVRDAITDQCETQAYTAIDDLLSRRTPRFRSGSRADILGERDTVEGTVASVLDLDGGVLPIQGRPALARPT